MPGRRQISAITGQERARRHLVAQAEAEPRPLKREVDRLLAFSGRNLAAAIAQPRAGVVVVGAQDAGVARILEAHDVGLRRGVVAHRRVAIQMIWRDVQKRRNGRRAGEELQLEARELHHDFVARPDLPQLVEQRCADVAAHVHRETGRCEHQPDERGRRGLARRSGDADDRHRAIAQRQLTIVAQPDAARDGGLHDRDRGRHAAAQAQQIGVVQQAQRVAAQRELQPRRLRARWEMLGSKSLQLGAHGAQLLGRPHVAECDVGALGQEEAGQCHPLAGCPEDDNALPGVPSWATGSLPVRPETLRHFDRS